MCSAELGPKLGHRKFSIKISFSLNEAIGFNGEEKRKKEKRKERNFVLEKAKCSAPWRTYHQAALQGRIILH